MSITVTRDVNNIPEILKIIEDLKNKKLKIGILSKETSMLLMVANVHEFGISITVTNKMRAYLHSIGIHLKKDTTVINIPERSFIRAGFDSEKNNIQNKINSVLENVISGAIDIDTFYEFIGNYCVTRLQEYLINLRNPPLYVATIKRKHSSNPLIDTGRLMYSIAFEII